MVQKIKFLLEKLIQSNGIFFSGEKSVRLKMLTGVCVYINIPIILQEQ